MAKDDSSVRGTVLVVDDEASIRESLRMILEFESYRVREAASGDEALESVRAEPPQAILLDIKMPEMDGLAVMRALQERGYDIPVLIITGHGDVATAVEATKGGAYDFFEKPLQRDRVLVSLRNAVESQWLRRENRQQRHQPDDLIGSSSAVRALREVIEKAAPTPATVLITGESGTGKELVAREIHRQSQRGPRTLVQVNCAAIPEELIESELFGHEKGSFTGASRKQVGKFVVADGGTIFLDEVGDMSAKTQAKVLRVLQNGEVEPVGAQRTVQVDVRVVAATNRELTAEIQAGRFREDLFYRLNVLPIQTPALREHLDDLPELVSYFVRRFGEANNYPAKEVTAEGLAALKSHPWRGNIRELRNVVERLLILSPTHQIDEKDVAAVLGAGGGRLAEDMLSAATLREFREAAERLFLIRKLEENEWNVTRTAQAVDTPRSNLYKKMDQYGIKREGGNGD
jgi:two-component system, NtrC family, nitrogen regulation response regulator NtrX